MAEQMIKSPEQIEKEKKAAKKLQRAAKKSAAEVLKELVDKNDKKYQDALKVMRPSLYGGVERTSGRERNSISKDFIHMIMTKKNVNEDEIFKVFRLGRKECSVLIRKSLKAAVPAERNWISFDEEKGIYSFVSKGPKAPAGWDGYVPVDEVVEVK